MIKWGPRRQSGEHTADTVPIGHCGEIRKHCGGRAVCWSTRWAAAAGCQAAEARSVSERCARRLGGGVLGSQRAGWQGTWRLAALSKQCPCAAGVDPGGRRSLMLVCRLPPVVLWLEAQCRCSTAAPLEANPCTEAGRYKRAHAEALQHAA
ncbi:hypothetical protein NDU88_004202 [Pleurodeles waltl]|uniref:Uncharacterized protein n=1 Tax=Pleurodeles waltl TaxID=8319 RepID=A0AAV7W491_PLEWA|nr:hypothetical protein NDU88_004202 [Pleurodeles waltl]